MKPISYLRMNKSNPIFESLMEKEQSDSIDCGLPIKEAREDEPLAYLISPDKYKRLQSVLEYDEQWNFRPSYNISDYLVPVEKLKFPPSKLFLYSQEPLENQKSCLMEELIFQINTKKLITSHSQLEFISSLLTHTKAIVFETHNKTTIYNWYEYLIHQKDPIVLMRSICSSSI